MPGFLVGSNHKGISRYTTDPDLLNQMIDEFIESVMEEGDSILAERPRIYTLQPQSSFVVIDQKTGHVMAVYGGIEVVSCIALVRR